MNRSTIEAHYETLLGERYTWMLGGLESCLRNARELLTIAGLVEKQHAPVLDLGSGPGYHAKALAEQGTQVIAVDVSDQCLTELRRNCLGLDVVPIHADLLHADRYAQHGPFSAVLCVGDTLTHLESPADVDQLLIASCNLLASGGKLVLEFREQKFEPAPADCILTIRADPQRIMQCVLHFSVDRIWVTDVVLEWDGNVWTTLKSSYPKLRLYGQDIAQRTEKLGLKLLVDQVRNGKRLLVLQR